MEETQEKFPLMTESDQITKEVGSELNEIEKEGSSSEGSSSESSEPKTKYMKWIKISVYIIFLLLGQAMANLLGRLYFAKGGNSKCIGTLVQVVGFPIFLPYYFITETKKKTNTHNISQTEQQQRQTTLELVVVYVSLGLFLAADDYMFSVGLMYLPVSTYSLICSSQIAFNAIFSFFLNSQKFTPAIIISLILLTLSSTLLVFQTESDGSVKEKASKAKYIIGFVCTMAGAAGYGLLLSLTQLFFTKVMKSESFKAMVDMIVYRSLVASVVIIFGLFMSGEWRDLKREMNEFELGKASYFMTLVFITFIWQAFTIGCVGLIFEVSSLFSNAVSVVGLPIVPVAAVIVFHDEMSKLKGVSMALAIAGFISYVYQQYVDDFKSKKDSKSLL
ncbi:probable purine permease 10 [Benincasa hispida]|uniref:probable purine permease 10 n=1 Tax=Benincasa hispida TaxID=102211 RepID=UPI0019014B9E|nr:probable purine permease 10 [Benincasa hispida]